MLSYHMMLSDIKSDDVEEERRRGKARVRIDVECFAPCVENEGNQRLVGEWGKERKKV